MPKNNDLYFEVDSRLLVQLGENLVTNKSTALAELIKNSYDADATEVKIKMHNIAKPGGTLEISDNGQGMTLDRFKKTWMRIGTRDKELNPVSMKFKRVKAGDKGIGRFACRLLSDNLYLESISKNKNGTYEKIEIKFNWNDFTSGSDIDKIPISFNRVKLKQSSKTGTKIILNKLSDGWQKREVILMRNEIRILADPTNVFLNIDDPEDPLQFKIIMDIPEYPDTAVKIDENFYTNSWAQINGNIDEKGSANYRLLTKSKIVNELDEFFPISKPYMHLKNVELKFYVFAYRGDLFKNSNWSFKRTRDFLEENAGIKVYSDNFRVFGYGAKGDDWLSLTRDRARSYSPLSDEFMDLTTETRPGLRLFRNEVLVGFVKFSRKDNPKLQITANRNDLINNQAFQELKIYSRKAVEYAVALYSQELLKEDEIKIKEKEYIAKKRREEAITVEKKVKKEIKELNSEVLKNIKEVENLINKASNRVTKTSEERRKIEKEDINNPGNLKEFVKKIDAEKKALENLNNAFNIANQKQKNVIELKTAVSSKLAEVKYIDLDAKSLQIIADEAKLDTEKILYRSLASTGTLIVIFQHELNGLIGNMEDIAGSFAEIHEKAINKDSNLKAELEEFNARINMVKEFGMFLGVTIGRESITVKQPWTFKPILEATIKPFNYYCKEYGIQIKNAISPILRSPEMYKSEITSIFHNLISNAMKAVKGEVQRKILINGYEESKIIYLEFLDTGIGLDKSKWEIAFKPFESFSKEDSVLGAGTGLGLKLVRDIVATYNGIVEFRNPPKGWNTRILVQMPLEGYL